MFHSNFCYPIFNNVQDLTSVTILYVYDCPNERDKETQKPKKKWFKMFLGENEEILYDNPYYDPDSKDPVKFKVVEKADNKLGKVQGIWFKLGDNHHSFDGLSLVENILDLGDSISYNICQSDRATEYSCDPQAIFSGMNKDEINDLVKSKNKGWVLGKDGRVNFLESSGGGVANATEMERRLIQKSQEITRAVEHDPQKILSSAQSGRAMEILHQPLVDMIQELRPEVGTCLVKALVLTLSTVASVAKEQRKLLFPIPNNINFSVRDYDINLKWGRVFPETIQDISSRVDLLLRLSSANIISRKTVLRLVSSIEEFGINDVEEEMKEVETQKQFNPVF